MRARYVGKYRLKSKCKRTKNAKCMRHSQKKYKWAGEISTYVFEVVAIDLQGSFVDVLGENELKKVDKVFYKKQRTFG